MAVGKSGRVGLFGSWPLALLIGASPVGAERSARSQCLLGALEHADDATTVAELRAACAASAQAEVVPPASPTAAVAEPVASRVALERKAAANPFTIVPHRPNYAILAAYNFVAPNRAPFEQQNPGENNDLDRWEAKFQISLKVPLVYDIFKDNGHLYFGYTNRSFWQVYDKDRSRPFRETDHEPEVWLSFENDWEALGWRNALVDVGFSHQSNGQSGALSRSWNRLYARLVFESENAVFAIKPWWRIPENAGRDDNPDIEDYLGNFEFQGAYRRGQSTYSLMLRNNLDFENNKGAIQVDWSFPLHRRLRGYLQWFNGYGESLIDYDARVNSIGVGVRITDWL
jgi:phospholipase A1